MTIPSVAIFIVISSACAFCQYGIILEYGYKNK
jgi:hypothetical protein